MTQSTILTGIPELRARKVLNPKGRVRQLGGRRKRVQVVSPDGTHGAEKRGEVA